MTTVASVLNGMRYDLLNYANIEWDPDQMLHYLNRSVNILDQRLVAWNSDQTFTQANATLAEDANYVDCPTRTLAVREVWVGEDRKTQVPPHELYYRRRFRTSDSAEFTYWAHVQNQIQFEVSADAEYTVVVMYDQYSADLTSDGDMPYNGLYDDVLREVAVQMCFHKKTKRESQTDAVYAQIFDQVLTLDLVNRKFVRKQYRLDF